MNIQICVQNKSRLTKSTLTTASVVYKDRATQNIKQQTSTTDYTKRPTCTWITSIHTVSTKAIKKLFRSVCTHSIELDYRLHLFEVGFGVHIDHNITWGMRNGMGIGAGMTRPIGESHVAIGQSSWCGRGYTIQEPMTQYQERTGGKDQRRQETEKGLKSQKLEKEIACTKI